MSEELQTDAGEDSAAEPAAEPAPKRKERSRSARIASLDLGDMPFVSQREYNPTPYVGSIWEIVGAQVAERDFMPLEVNVVHQDMGEPDPMFEVFDAGTPRETEKIYYGEAPKPAPGSEAAAIDPEQLAALEAQWQAQVELAHQAGYQEGAQAAEATIAERYEQLSSRVKSVTDAVYQQWANLAGQLERNALQLSLNVAKKILSTTADLKPDYIVTVIREGLASLGAAKPVRIRVSPDDYEFLTVIGLPIDLNSQEVTVTYVADESIQHGCVVETDFGEVDLVIERMWEQIKDNIYGPQK